ncbi:AmmeMemoRadiSam system protein B [Psychrobium sp. 1_MG-2023]|uniref:AmmeMemoRadiSam system protein B n=1 Tax=Psychrobium sp. 1_MG-2023 TaxID=3062624 RepID=UPI002733FCB6|nr:AmmeMemoRadiSam system protein B [Psychrobium sp. 1_MG-2023]MDP2561631.1 AmmeMemoRadiSam system protein B [Psychrobium sp. 1_MG-2023]
MSKRMPAVAGSFYPEQKIQLQQELTQLFLSTQPLTKYGKVKALIVPHAGYCYSGNIAAAGYHYLTQQPINKVVILGPSHRVALRGCAVPSHSLFTTPLGDIPIDLNTCRELLNQGLVVENNQAHQWEHSIEVQLPFLQQGLSTFELLPIVVGQCSSQQVCDILNYIEPLNSTLLVISTDLSHFHSYQHAQAIDNNTINKILALDTDVSPEQACGSMALNGLLAYAQQQQWQPHLIANANSADISNQAIINRERVVGYASFIMCSLN